MADKLDRFTKRARRALTLAQEEALRLNHRSIGTEHLLLGLVRLDGGRALKVLRALAVEPAQVIRAVERVAPRGDRVPFGKPSLAARAKRAIELAVDEARLTGDSSIGTAHLLLGLAREGEGAAIRVLNGLGVNIDQLRTQTAREMLAARQAPTIGDLPTTSSSSSSSSASPPPSTSSAARRMKLAQSSGPPTFASEHYDAVVDFIRSRTRQQPTVGLILGTGLSPLAEEIEKADIIAYEEIPLFPSSTVAGHAGRLVIGKLEGVAVCAMQGRFHFYEGYGMQEITLPVRVMQRLGVETLIVTNAAGGIHPDLETGDLMLIEDHVNFVGMAGNHPLVGPNLDEFGPRFPAANRVYTRRLRELAQRVANEQEIELHSGVYAALSGPSFETPAEIRFLRTIGADAVGMSTAHEALVAHHAGLAVLAISTITNVAIDAVDVDEEPAHEEIAAAGQVIVPKLTTLVRGVLARLNDASTA